MAKCIKAELVCPKVKMGSETATQELLPHASFFHILHEQKACYFHLSNVLALVWMNMHPPSLLARSAQNNSGVYPKKVKETWQEIKKIIISTG